MLNYSYIVLVRINYNIICYAIDPLHMCTTIPISSTITPSFLGFQATGVPMRWYFMLLELEFLVHAFAPHSGNEAEWRGGDEKKSKQKKTVHDGR